jgi:hypothetical protein
MILLELLLLVLFFMWKIIKMGQMINEYRIKYVMVMVGLFIAIKLIIQPM